MKSMSEKMSKKIKETIATSVSEALTKKSWAGNGPECTILLFNEPKMPIELVLEDAE